MSSITNLTAEQSVERERLATYHGIHPSAASALRRSKCSTCDTDNIAWVTTEAYLSMHADSDAPQHVLDYPEGEGWICLECVETGYIDTDILTDEGESFEQAAKGVHAFNHMMLISKIPDTALGELEKESLDYILTSVNVAGRHAEYDLFFELVENFSPLEFELAGGSIARELKVHATDSTVLPNMILLSLLAAPIVSAFEPETTPSLQMPLIVKKLGQALTEYWGTDDFHLTDDQRANFARGLLMRRLCNPDVVVSHGHQEDLYTQWIGESFEVLSELVEDVKKHPDFGYDEMVRWVGKDEAYRFVVDSGEAVASLTSSIELGYALEAAELKDGSRPGGHTVCDRVVDPTGHYIFTLSQLAFLNRYETIHGYAGREVSLPVFRMVEALGLKGFNDGGDGLAEEVILALTSVEPAQLEQVVNAAGVLDDYRKLKMIGMLDNLIANVDTQDARSGDVLSLLREYVNAVNLVEAV